MKRFHIAMALAAIALTGCLGYLSCKSRKTEAVEAPFGAPDQRVVPDVNPHPPLIGMTGDTPVAHWTPALEYGNSNQPPPIYQKIPFSPPPQRRYAPVVLPPQDARITAMDLQYLRWLIQFDGAVKRMSDQQMQVLNTTIRQNLDFQMRYRGFNMPSRAAENAEVNRAIVSAANARQFAAAWQQAEAQFRQMPAPPNCQAVSIGYGRLMRVLREGIQKFAVQDERISQAMQHPDSAPYPQMTEDDKKAFQRAASGKNDPEVQSALNEVNESMSTLAQRFPGQIPNDIAAYRVR